VFQLRPFAVSVRHRFELSDRLHNMTVDGAI